MTWGYALINEYYRKTMEIRARAQDYNAALAWTWSLPKHSLILVFHRYDAIHLQEWLSTSATFQQLRTKSAWVCPISQVVSPVLWLKANFWGATVTATDFRIWNCCSTWPWAITNRWTTATTTWFFWRTCGTATGIGVCHFFFSVQMHIPCSYRTIHVFSLASQ